MKHFLLLLVSNIFLAAFPSAAITVGSLGCEHRENPLGVDVSQPRLSWILESSQRADRQMAYQILAASGKALLKQDQGDLWDSGKVASDETIQIPYAGKPLKSSRQVFWKVRMWDANDKVSAWSSPATWTMGLLADADWQAKWITAPTNVSSVLFRREFTVKRGLRRAIVHVCGLGQYELSLNGNKVGDDLLAPGWSQYKKTCLYDSLDLTSQLRAGKNAVGLILGNGMYHIAADRVRYVKFRQSFGPLKAIAQIQLDYADGTTEIIGTDSNWQAGSSPITFNNIFAGEDFDARLEQKGWDQPGFKTGSRWTAARETSGPGGTLKGLSCAAPPIKMIEVLLPVSAKQLGTNVTVYDLGQNASLMPRIVVSGKPGSFVRMIPAELLKPDGTVDRASCTQDGIRPAWWQYTLKGDGKENWFPKFFYQGCRYLQVECHAANDGEPLPKLERIEGVVVHSSAAPIGEFATSNTLFNRIYQLVRWAQRSNMMSLMTDCPHREKLGWLEETHLNGPSLRYNFDMAALLQKSMNDMADSQLANGFVPNIAPEYFIASKTNLTDAFRNSPEWGGAFLMVAWQQYQFDGDIALLSRYYEDMKRYVAFLASTAKDHVVSTGLGDWYDLGPKPPWGSQLTPPALTATAFYQHYNWILARTAGLLGKPDESKQFDELAGQIRTAFNQKFFNPATGQYATGSQCANSLAVVMNLVEPTNRAAVLEAIVADVRGRSNALTAGDVGYRYLLRALAENGRSDVIFDMNNQSEKPGYGYQLKMGATSLTEKWDAGVGSFGSQNHFMLGQINEWFFHDLAGIASDPSAPGFKKIVIRPAVVGDLTWVRGKYDSVRGPITTAWKRDAKQFTLDVAIPPNTTATVFLPAEPADDIREGKTAAEKSPGVKILSRENGRAVFEIASGKYKFTVASQRSPAAK
ncbi:MAG TPA: glycoside hydrolase family 78 protein [Candidatus Limnocylindrales bacterium]|nr:glycoside hydrolase family 78 protein [Candidatus Limnocylindrales bacterium]